MFQYIIYNFYISNNIPENWHKTKWNNFFPFKKVLQWKLNMHKTKYKNSNSDSGWLNIHIPNNI